MEFEGASRLELKSTFIASINGLELNREEKEEIVEEKAMVFRMNNLIVENIQPAWSHYKRLAQFGTVTAAVLAALKLRIISLLPLTNSC